MKIHEFLTDETQWTRGAFARKKNGVSCSSLDPEAISWCLSGLVRKVYPEFQREGIINILCKELKYDAFGLSIWNDLPGRTFSDIKALALQKDI